MKRPTSGNVAKALLKHTKGSQLGYIDFCLSSGMNISPSQVEDMLPDIGPNLSKEIYLEFTEPRSGFTMRSATIEHLVAKDATFAYHAGVDYFAIIISHMLTNTVISGRRDPFGPGKGLLWAISIIDLSEAPSQNE